MAVTSLWRVRGRAKAVLDYVKDPEKTLNGMSDEELTDISGILEYVDDEVKTEKHFYTTGIGCDRDFAAEEFEMTKKRFGKQGGIVAAHAYQSFEEEDISPEEAHAIGVELAKELWGDRFQVIVSTHLNTDHVHNHFCINSISYKDGKRFHFCTARMLELREASDRLCREHGLSVIEQPQGKGKSMYESRLEKAGMPTRYSVAREAIDKAISRSLNIEEFKYELRQLGYKYRFNQNRKYWTVTIPGWTQPIRIHQLGEDYTRERVMERIYANDERVRTDKFRQMATYRPNYYRLGKRIHKINCRTGFEKLYLRICYEMGYLPKYRQDPLKIHRLFKADIEKCEKYAEQAKLLCRHSITTESELTAFVAKLDDDMGVLSERRDELRKLVKRNIPEAERTAAREDITKLTSELRKMRHEKRLCEDIRKRAPELEKRIRTMDEELCGRENVRRNNLVVR